MWSSSHISALKQSVNGRNGSAAGGGGGNLTLTTVQPVVADLGQTVGWSATIGSSATVGVYVLNLDDSMTPDEYARIQDAIDALNAT
jgi:hypothetical protein